MCARGLGCLDELVAHRTPLVGVLGVPDSRVEPVQGEGEGGWVTQPAGHRHGLLAERGDAFRRAAVAQRAGEPGEQLDAKDAVLRGEGGEGVLEQWDELVVLAGAHPDEASAVPDGGSGKQVGAPQPSRHDRGRRERLLGDHHLTAAGLSFSQCQQELAPSRLVRLRLGVERSQSQAVQPGGFLVGQKPDRAIARADGPGDRPVSIAARGGLEEMVRDLRQMGLGVGRVKGNESLADLRMEAGPPGRSELFVQRIADERVGKLQASLGARNCADYRCGASLVEEPQESAAPHGAHALERGQAELASEPRRQPQEGPAIGGQTPQAIADRVVDTRRDRQPFHRPFVEQPLVAEQAG